MTPSLLLLHTCSILLSYLIIRVYIKRRFDQKSLIVELQHKLSTRGKFVSFWGNNITTFLFDIKEYKQTVVFVEEINLSLA